MKILISIFAFLHVALFAFESQEAAKQQMHSDLEFFRATFNAQYAPLEWKGYYSNWDIDTAINKAQNEVQSKNSIKIKDYQRILKKFFTSLGDYHVHVMFYSTEASYFPIHFRGVDGHYYISRVDRFSFNDQKTLAIKPGDELMTYNDLPMDQAVRKFQEKEFNPYLTPTDISNSHRDFSLRLGALGHEIPQGAVTITVKHQATKEIKKYTISWLHQDERIANIIPKNAKGARPAIAQAAKKASLGKSMLYPKFIALQNSPFKMDRDTIGSRESFVPQLGEVVWSSNRDTCHFHAYIFKSPSGKLIGYVRIPHYSGSTEESQQFRNIIAQFENTTEALIVDQVNNPGGSIFYMYSLAACLANKPLIQPKHREAITQKEVYEAIETLDQFHDDLKAEEVFGKDIEGYKVTQEFYINYKKSMQFLLDQWNAGKTFTDPSYLFGIEAIKPDPATHYTKPILFLINELDYSCGDFMPAMLQDNHRATLFGAKTAGAGGFVLSAEHPNLFSIESFSYTGSIAQRADLNPIENLGVQPDIEYHITKEDLLHSYRGYARKLLEELEILLTPKS